MKKGWSVGKHRIVVDLGPVATLRVDGAPPALTVHRRVLGTWPVVVGNHSVELRRVRSLDIARNEIWLSGVKVPHSREPILLKEPPLGALCKKSHREPTPAEIACAACGVTLCADCRAADALRCQPCFLIASTEVRSEERRARIIGPLLGALLFTVIAISGFVAESLRLALGGFVLLVFLVVRGLIRERLEAEPLDERLE